MSGLSIGFEMTNALISQAVREDCIFFAKGHVKVKDMLVILASTAIFTRAVFQSHWFWWFAGLPIGLFLDFGYRLVDSLPVVTEISGVTVSASSASTSASWTV